MKSKTKNRSSYKVPAIVMLITGVSLYVLLPRLDSFKASLHIIISAKAGYVLLALALFLASYLASTAVFCSISFYKLRYWTTFLVQVADGFTNKITPAGLGAIATNTLYLAKQSKSSVKAGYTAVLNNLIGFAAHITLLMCLLVFSPATESVLNFHLPRIGLFAVLLPGILLLALAIFWRKIEKATASIYKDLILALKYSIRNPGGLFLGFIFAMGVTIFYSLTLFAVTKSLAVDITLLQTFTVLTVGVMAAVVTPTPGGLVGVEAGLVAALIAFGIQPVEALSVTLFYRLITFWLPIPMGAVALEIAAKKGYLSKKPKQR